MKTLRCPFCGSENLIWDFATGSIICTSCGSVIDVIYEYENGHHNPTATYRRSSVVDAVLYKEKTAKNRRRLMLIMSRTALYSRIRRRIRKERIVNEEAFIALASGVKPQRHLIEHRMDEKLRRRLATDLSYLVPYLEIVERDPVLSSRTFRGKVAIAMILHSMRTTGRPCLKRIAQELRMSLTHVKRLEKLVLKRIKVLKA